MLEHVSRGIEEALHTLPEGAETFAAGLSAADENCSSRLHGSRSPPTI